MMRGASASLLLVLLPLVLAKLSLGPVEFGHVRSTVDGVQYMGAVPPSPSPSRITQPRVAPTDPRVIYNVYYNESIFTDATLSIPDSQPTTPYVTGAAGDNGGLQASLTAWTALTNRALWDVTGVGFVSAAGDEVAAGVRCSMTPTSAQCQVLAWDIITGKQRWVITVDGVEGADIGVSPDGLTVTVLFTAGSAPFPDPKGYARVIDYDSVTGKQLGVWNGPPAEGGRFLVTTNSLFAIVDLATVVVIRRSDAMMVWNHTFPFSTSALCMSEDGKYVSYGFQQWMLYTRVGNDYSLTWTVVPPGDSYAGACGIANNTIALAWYSGRYNQNLVQFYTTGPSSSHDDEAARAAGLIVGKTPVWSYNYPVDVGSTEQDLPVALAFTSSGSYFVVATWGPSNTASPQVAVFTPTKPQPVYTLTTPGSMFSADITETKAGKVYVVAAGKHVHANQMGFGGDLFSCQIV